MTVSAAVTTAPTTTFDIYPFGTKLKDRRTKVVHFVRHAEGTHNVNREYRSKSNIDARLTETGLQQCHDLAQRILQANNDESSSSSTAAAALYHLRESTELIVTSPLTRCIQTAIHSMKPLLQQRDQEQQNAPRMIVAHDDIRETVNYNCDRRRELPDIAKEHPVIDYSHVKTPHDDVWKYYEDRFGCDETYTKHRESGEIHVVAERGRAFFHWLQDRPEENIVVCSHSAFMRCLWNFGNPGGVPRLPLQYDDTPNRPPPVEIPVVRYQCHKDPDSFASSMRKDYENCELRSMVVAFG